MTKHFFIISAIFSMACFVDSVVNGYNLYTILGWGTASISGLAVVLSEQQKKLR